MELIYRDLYWGNDFLFDGNSFMKMNILRQEFNVERVVCKRVCRTLQCLVPGAPRALEHSSEFRSVSTLCLHIQVSSDQYQSRVCTCYYRNIRRNFTEMRLSLLRWTLIIWFSFHTMRALQAGAAPQPTTKEEEQESTSSIPIILCGIVVFI